jgi:fumarate hydratase class II
VHPNDDVNKSQSSNDVFPTAMHVAAVDALTHQLLPALQAARHAGGQGRGVCRHRQDRPHPPAGRHAADAGAGVSGWVAQLDHGEAACARRLPHLCELALGGTAVGTGLNAPKGYAEAVAAELAA